MTDDHWLHQAYDDHRRELHVHSYCLAFVGAHHVAAFGLPYALAG